MQDSMHRSKEAGYDFRQNRPKCGVNYLIKRQHHKDKKLAGLPVRMHSPELPDPQKQLVPKKVQRLLLVAQCWQVTVRIANSCMKWKNERCL